VTSMVVVEEGATTIESLKYERTSS